jgi:O-methyltransferase
MMATDENAERYLDLMKKVLTHSLWVERTRSIDPSRMPRSAKRFAVETLANLLKRFRVGLVRQIPSDPRLRVLGEDWPDYAHTMIGMKRLDNIQECVKTILCDRVPGDLIETGVWRGGAVIFMRALLRAYGIQDRNVWAADSFCGLPEPDLARYPADRNDICYQREFTAVSLDQVKGNFELYNLLDEKVQFLKGWFKETLPDAPIERLALLRLDGDMYQSTMEGLVHLYPKLSRGGFVIVDDYGAGPCRQAVEDFRKEALITDPIVPIDNWGVFWRRS